MSVPRDIYLTFPSPRTALSAMRRLREVRPNARVLRDPGSSILRISRTWEPASHYTEVLGCAAPVVRVV